MKLDRRLLYTLSILGVAALYLAAAKLGLSLAFLNRSATAVWPPTGIALAAVLVLGYRVWPGIVIGAFLANVTTSGSVPVSMAITVGNTLEAIFGAWLVRRFANGRHAFERPSDVFKFALLAGGVGTLVSPTIGVTSLALSGLASWADYGVVWLTWWLGDAMGALVVTPTVILWANQPVLSLRGRRVLEAVLALATAILIAFIVFSGVLPASLKGLPIQFVLFPVLVWVAFRFGQREVATVVLLVSLFAVAGTVNGYGPFILPSENSSLLLVQTYMGVLGLTGLGVAAVVSERRIISDALRRSRDELEQRVQERTRSLSSAVEELGTQVAERKRTADALQRSERRIREIIEAMPVAVYVCDAEGLITSFNPSAAQLWGREPKLLDTQERYSGSFKIHYPDGREMPHSESPMAQVLRTGVPQRNQEILIERPDASRATALVNALPLTNEEGDLVGAINCLIDITERKESEEALRRESELNETMVKAQDSLGEGVGIVEGDHLVFANDALCKIYGYSRAELLALPSYMDLIPSDQRPPLLDRHARRFRGEIPSDAGEATIIRKDGRRIAIEYAVKILDPHDPVRLFTIVRDVTARRKEREALQASEVKFRGLLESAPDAMVIVDGEGMIVFANSQTEKLFGYERDELHGQSVEMLIPERFREQHLVDRIGYFLEPEVRAMGAGLELAGLRRDRSEFPVDISLSPLKTPGGILVTATIRDITERKRAELELQTSNSRLRELTSRLQEVREEERARIARELHDELGQALTALKFDLSTLTAGLPESDAVSQTRARTMAEQIDVTVQAVRRIGSELRPGMLDDLGLAAAIEWQAQEFAARTGIDCRVTLPARHVDLDREKATAVFRVFQETLTNVARHSNATSVLVCLEAVGNDLRLEVRDNGRGFENAGEQAKHSLGLLGMKERAEILHGSFDVSSVIGQGTTVRMILPL